MTRIQRGRRRLAAFPVAMVGQCLAGQLVFPWFAPLWVGRPQNALKDRRLPGVLYSMRHTVLVETVCIGHTSCLCDHAENDIWVILVAVLSCGAPDHREGNRRYVWACNPSKNVMLDSSPLTQRPKAPPCCAAGGAAAYLVQRFGPCARRSRAVLSQHQPLAMRRAPWGIGMPSEPALPWAGHLRSLLSTL